MEFSLFYRAAEWHNGAVKFSSLCSSADEIKRRDKFVKDADLKMLRKLSEIDFRFPETKISELKIVYVISSTNGWRKVECLVEPENIKKINFSIKVEPSIPHNFKANFKEIFLRKLNLGIARYHQEQVQYYNRFG